MKTKKEYVEEILVEHLADAVLEVQQVLKKYSIVATVDDIAELVVNSLTNNVNEAKKYNH